jgi:GNAT superfamily N-acetyltransferase
VIRPAVEADLPRLLEMGRRFFDASGYSDITEYDPASTEASLRMLMEVGVLLVAERDEVIGCAGALVYPFYFNSGHLTGQELFWWVEPEHRGVGMDLYHALEQAVKDKGAQSFSMIALDKLNPERVGEMYRKVGYRPSDHSYIKRL